jgi:hypothetical protein
VTGKASRDRGARAERAVVTWLRNNGFPAARRHHGADGRAPGDIMGVPDVCIEVKDRASSAYPTWREQLLTECPPGDVPVLVRRVRGVADVGMWDAETLAWGWHSTMPLDIHVCPRTNRLWLRTTFADIAAMFPRRDGTNGER